MEPAPARRTKPGLLVIDLANARRERHPADLVRTVDASGRDRVDNVAILAQPGGERFAHNFFVVYDQNLPAGAHTMRTFRAGWSRPRHGEQSPACLRSI